MQTYRDYLNYCLKKYKNDYFDENEANYFLANALHIEQYELFVYLDNIADEKIIKKFIKDCRTCSKLVPPQYITGHTYFYYLDLYVNHNVLIPRKETEELVELFLKDFKDVDNLKVLDMCCGSGCIGLAVKNQKPNYEVTCSDVSKKALKVCRKNATKSNLKINIIKSNLFENIIDDYDVIICNPPYIAPDDPNVSGSTKLYEPSIALFTTDKDGVEFYDLIFRCLTNRKFKKAYFEIGYNQKEPIKKLLNKYSLNGSFFKDLSNKDRMLVITK